MKPVAQIWLRWALPAYFLIIALTQIQGQIYYVNHTAAGLLNGSSWTDAYA